MTVSSHRRTTARLVLDPLTQADAADIFEIYGDPATWEHLPDGRFTELAQAEQQVEKSLASHRARGLGMWGIRIGEASATDELPAGTFIGSGGLQYVDEAGIWNLGYRLAPRAWGRGFATEISRAAVAAGAAIAPDVPITARVLSNNPASVAVLEKLGLALVWEGASASAGVGSGPAAPLRRVYADREPSPAAHEWLVRNA